MSTADFLLELRCEEIPARMQAKARNDLARLVSDGLSAAGLTTAGITTYSTPRRLALIAKALPLATAPVRDELKGPRTSAPAQALDGFLKKTGLTADQLEDRGGVWFAVIDKPGRDTAAVLAELVAQVVRDFPWPKSMRWGAASASSASMRWVRPLHAIVALLGEEIVPVDIDGVTCGAMTLGHRFHHPGPITIGGAHDYVEKLRACHVLVDQEEREAIVRTRAAELADDAGYLLVADEGLVIENAGLTEWPVPLLGSFDPDFLSVPEEVVQLTARINQKYFVLKNPAGGLAPHFICTANIAASDGGTAIVAGNERVLAARLSDARFFWEGDLKVPLDQQAAKLGQILFHEKLGTLADRVERIAALARWLATNVVPGADPEAAERAARLAKADLVTGMVGEFPELQGIIGSYLARAQGEGDVVADAIRDHYKPVGQGDSVPSAPVSVAVALADKLDTLSVFFAAGMPPTGSKDPFALRRAALGSIQLILDNGLRLPLDDALVGPMAWMTGKSLGAADQQALAAAIAAMSDAGIALDPTAQAAMQVNAQAQALARSSDAFEAVIAPALIQLRDFFADRLKVQQREAGVRHDLIDAALGERGEDDLVRLVARVRALQGFIETGEGRNLLAGYKRAANILKKERWDPLVATSADIHPDEAALAQALDAAGPRVAAALAGEDFVAAMAVLASLRGAVDAFFERVTVNADDAGVRARRLGLLAHLRDSIDQVADLARVEG